MKYLASQISKVLINYKIGNVREKYYVIICRSITASSLMISWDNVCFFVLVCVESSPPCQNIPVRKKALTAPWKWTYSLVGDPTGRCKSMDYDVQSDTYISDLMSCQTMLHVPLIATQQFYVISFCWRPTKCYLCCTTTNIVIHKWRKLLHSEREVRQIFRPPQKYILRPCAK